MLSPADAQLAARDAALPGLATLLDTEQLLELLRTELSLDWQQLTITPDYVRYKPGTSCLVGFSGTYRQLPIHFYARLHPPEERDKAAKPLLRPMVESPLGSGGLLLEKPCLLFMFFPNDHEIRAMRELNTPSTRSRLLNKLLPQMDDISDLEMSIIRYKPERRCVSLIRIGSEHRFLLKAHTSGFPLSTAASVHDFQRDPDIQLRPRLASLPEKGLALYPWVPGTPLSQESPTEPLQRVGRQLARLHGLNAIDPAAASTPATMTSLSLLEGALAGIAAIAPDQLARAQELAERIRGLWSEQPATLTGIRCRIHGDFSSDQVILSGDAIHLIDFDRTCISHPVHDPGSFLARLHHDQISGIRSAARLRSHGQALMEGYCSASRWPLADLMRPALALHLLQLAPEAFRRRRANWPEILNQVLTRIELILHGEGELHAA